MTTRPSVRPDPQFRDSGLAAYPGYDPGGPLQGVGGSATLPLIEALNTHFTTVEAQQADMVKQIRDVATALHMNMRNLGGGSSAAGLASVVPIGTYSSSSRVALDSTESLRGALTAASGNKERMQARIPSSDIPLSHTERAAYYGVLARESAPLAPTTVSSGPEQMGQQVPMQEGGFFTPGGHQTLRQHIAKTIAARLQSDAPNLVQQAPTGIFRYDKETGTWRYPSGRRAPTSLVEDTIAERTGMRMNKADRWYETDTGKLLSKESAAERFSGAVRTINADTGEVLSQQALSRIQRGQMIRGGVSNMLGQIAEGEGVIPSVQHALSGMGLGTAAKSLGYVGAAYTAATQIRDFANNQRAENAQYQRALGGSNVEGFGERIGEKVFSLGQNWFGGMAGGEASALYKGAMNIYGTDSSARNTAMDFGTSMWRKLGLEVSESLKFVGIAAQAGNDSLRGLAQSLTDVTHAAREAGINAGAARDIFARQLQAGTGTVGAGPVPQNIAAMITQAQVGLGRRFQDIDLSQLMSQQSITKIASEQGISYAEASAKLQSDPTFAATSYNTLVRTSLGPLVGDPRIAARVREFAANTPNPTSHDWEKFANQIQQEFPDIADPRVLQGMLGQYVGNVPQDKAVEFALRAGYVQTAGGTTEGTFNVTAEQMPSAAPISVDFGAKKADAQTLAVTIGGGTSQYGTGSIPGLTDVMKAIGEEGQDPSFLGDEKRDYVRRFLQTGERQPALEASLSDVGESHGDRRYQVQTKDGPREVTFGELIRDYADQASTALEIRGNNAGMTLAEAYGMEETAPGTSTAQAAKSGWEKGRNEGTSNRLEGDVRSGTQGQISIVAEPILRKYLQFLGTGQVASNPNRNTSGVAPLPAGEDAPTGQNK